MVRPQTTTGNGPVSATGPAQTHARKTAPPPAPTLVPALNPVRAHWAVPAARAWRMARATRRWFLAVRPVKRRPSMRPVVDVNMDKSSTSCASSGEEAWGERCSAGPNAAALEMRACLVVDADLEVVQDVLSPPPDALARPTVRPRHDAVVLGQQQLLQLPQKHQHLKWLQKLS